MKNLLAFKVGLRVTTRFLTVQLGMFFRVLVMPILVAAFWAIPGFPISLMGQEMRIESQIYDDRSEMPVAQNVTLFSNSVVYDFQLTNDAQPKTTEIVIFESRTRTIYLLDTEREIQLELPDLRLLKIFDGVRRATLQDQRTKFLIQDDFDEDTDWSTGWVTLTAPSMTYRFKGEQPKDISVVPIYFEFLEHFTRLIASDPQKLPPFARVKLNQSLKRKGWLPSEVQIAVKRNGLFRKAFSLKSKHVVVTTLSDKDLGRISEAKKKWSSYPRVDLATYRNLEKSRTFTSEAKKSKNVTPDSETEKRSEPLSR